VDWREEECIQCAKGIIDSFGFIRPLRSELERRIMFSVYQLDIYVNQGLDFRMLDV
jgi:hypothetical protein